jgi:hypothetical protein
MRAEQQILAFRAAMLASLGLSGSCGGVSRAPDVAGGDGGSAGVTEGSGGTTGGTGVTAGTSGKPPTCTGSMPVLDEEGRETGFSACPDGLVHRVAPAQCRSDLPRADLDLSIWNPLECGRDEDCVLRSYGHCERAPGNPPTGDLICQYGCVADSDCDTGYVCDCGPDFGTCKPASCSTDADCGAGYCARVDDPGECQDGTINASSHFACTGNADLCHVGADCPSGRCGHQADARTCLPRELCGIGRPFLVGGARRTAKVAARSDFSASLEPGLDLDVETRAALARHWERGALLEHASIASFARFSLELLALGAPAELVLASASALADETLHAKLCFALAGAYAGHPVGPGPLSMSGVAPETDLARLVESAVVEGCIGETTAALEAALVARAVTDPIVRDVLERIAADEQRHAELAFRFVRWIVGAHPELAAVARAVLLREERALDPERFSPKPAEEDAWLSLGVCPEALAHGLRSRALAEVVAPCLAGVIEIPVHATPALAPCSPRRAGGGMLEAS